MKMALRFRTLVATALLAPALIPGNSAADELTVTATMPEVTVSTRVPGRNFMHLPKLEFDFAVDARCRDSFTPESISLSIADTRVSISADGIDADTALKISLTVPAAQIGPVAIENFCTGETGGGSSNRSIKVSSVLSAQAALLCTGEDSSEITYASTPLDVMLYCEPAPEARNPLLRPPDTAAETP